MQMEKDELDKKFLNGIMKFQEKFVEKALVQ